MPHLLLLYSHSPCACRWALSVRQSLKTHLKSNDQTTSLDTPKGRLSVNVYVMLGLPHTPTERCIYFRFFYMVILDLFRFTGGRQIKTNTVSAEPITVHTVNITSHINMYVCIHTYIHQFIHHCPTYRHTHRRQVKFEAMARWGLISKFRTSVFSSHTCHRKKMIRISFFYWLLV